MIFELKKKWVDALRSGNFKQGRRYLRITDNYCCLGVLCEITGVPIEPRRHMPELYDLKDFGLPYMVAIELASMNDSGKSFNEIANWIEDNV